MGTPFARKWSASLLFVLKEALVPQGLLAANTFLRDGLGNEHLWPCMLDLSSKNVSRWYESNGHLENTGRPQTSDLDG